MQVRKHGKYVSVDGGKEYRLLKEYMTAVEMNVEQELGIGPRAHESGSLCDAFFCCRLHRMILSFVSVLRYGTYGKESGDVW